MHTTTKWDRMLDGEGPNLDWLLNFATQALLAQLKRAADATLLFGYRNLLIACFQRMRYPVRSGGEPLRARVAFVPHPFHITSLSSRRHALSSRLGSFANFQLGYPISSILCCTPAP